MNAMILTVRNTNRGSLEDRIKFQQEMKKLGEKNAKKIIVTFPDGSEMTFDSSYAASRHFKLSPTVVGNWVKKGGPKTGKFKGYTARLV